MISTPFLRQFTSFLLWFGAVACGGSTSGATIDGAACQDCVPFDDLHWGMNGGLVAYQDTSRLRPCRSYTREREFANQTPLSCATSVPGCPERWIDRIVRDAADPVVRTALMDHQLYGGDPRPVDGQVLRVGIGNDFIEVGPTCSSGAVCKDPPDVVRDLVAALQELDHFALSGEPCHGVFGP
jgi:hypothetical protein